jgi:hypothetical protein
LQPPALLAIGEMAEKINLGFDMTIEIHAHESGELKKPRVDAAQGAGIAQRHETDQIALEPLDRPARREPVDLGRVDPRVDRARHQRHAARLRRIGILSHDRHRCEHRDAGLAHTDHMGARPQHLQKRDDVIDKVVEVEPAVLQTDVTGIVPVGNVDVMIGDQGLRRPAKQGRKMPRHRRYQENARLHRRHLLLEAQQRTERRAVNDRLAHGDTTICDLDRVDTKSGPTMTETRAGDKLAKGCSSAQ